MEPRLRMSSEDRFGKGVAGAEWLEEPRAYDTAFQQGEPSRRVCNAFPPTKQNESAPWASVTAHTHT